MNGQGSCRLCSAEMRIFAGSADLMVCNACRNVVLCLNDLVEHDRNSPFCSDACRLEFNAKVVSP